MHKHIVFIDNIKYCWNGDMDLYSDAIDFIPVSNSSRNTETQYTKGLAKRGNRYATSLLRSETRYFINKGLDQKVANKLMKWSEISTEPKIALFDWDGTISASEGFSLRVFDDFIQKPVYAFTNPMMDFLRPIYPILRLTDNNEASSRDISQIYKGLRMHIGGNNKSHKNLSIQKRRTMRRHPQNPYILFKNLIESPEYQQSRMQPLTIPPKEFLDDMFVYLMRPERVQMLRNLFRTLRANNVQIHILTHNPYASVTNPFRKIFVEMMWRVFNEDEQNEFAEQYKDRTGSFVRLYRSSSRTVSIVSREELDGMLHSTMDYTDSNEPFMKRNIAENIKAIAEIFRK